MLFVEIPEYRNKHIRVPVKVNFYVINGKRKRSQPQHFTYHPGETFSPTACSRHHALLPLRDSLPPNLSLLLDGTIHGFLVRALTDS